MATLQVLADYSGLNLTFGTLSALSKYTASSDKARQDATNPAHQKPGYFASEAKIVEEIRDATGTGEARNPISLLVEAADDIVYLAADVEDGVKKGVLSWLDVRNALTDEDSDSVRCALETQEQILKAGDSQVPLNNDINVSAFRTAAIHVMVEGAFKVFTKQYNKIIEGTYEHSLLPESDAAPLMSCLRKIGKVNVYPTRSTLTLELMGRHVIWGLLDIFWEGASEMPTTGDLNTTEFSGKAAALFSANYQQVFRQFVNAQTELPEDYHRLQLVTDYICGMTDSFAKRLHAMLFNGR